jgi:hypothetical protein
MRAHDQSKIGLVVFTILFLSLANNLHAYDAFPERTPTYAPYTAPYMYAPSIAAIANIDLATAMDIPPASIISISLGTSDPQGAFVFNTPLAGFPTRGSSFAVLSTGIAANASLPNSSGSLSAQLVGLNNNQGNDLVQFTLTLHVPAGAKFWAVDWKFLSEEFPEFVGSPYNDAFFIETPDSNIIITDNIALSNRNVAYDPFGSRVSINTTGATGMTSANAAGTTYDGATATLTTAARIPDGATQVTIVFSVTDLGDSIYDTAVFLDNFRFLTEYTPPPKLNSPGAKTLVPQGKMVPDKPTVILTHGLEAKADLAGVPDTLWIGTKEKQAAGLIKQETNNGINIFEYVWENAFQVGFTGIPSEAAYNAAQGYVEDAGANLAKELLKPENLGPTFNGKIQFIGHSLGTIVNAYAARLFLEKATNVKEAQFTALDRPDHVGVILGCRLPPECKGYDENFFGSVLQGLQTNTARNIHLVIDNYFSKEGAGVGDVTNGMNVYNHPELIEPNDLDDRIFDDEEFDNNHSGVHQWYRWTMNPNALDDLFLVCNTLTGELLNLDPFFDQSLDPCRKGWQWSIVRANPLPFPQTENKPVIATPLHTTRAIPGNMLISQRSGGRHELGGGGIQGH